LGSGSGIKEKERSPTASHHVLKCLSPLSRGRFFPKWGFEVTGLLGVQTNSETRCSLFVGEKGGGPGAPFPPGWNGLRERNEVRVVGRGGTMQRSLRETRGKTEWRCVGWGVCGSRSNEGNYSKVIKRQK